MSLLSQNKDLKEVVHAMQEDFSRKGVAHQAEVKQLQATIARLESMVRESNDSNIKDKEEMLQRLVEYKDVALALREKMEKGQTYIAELEAQESELRKQNTELVEQNELLMRQLGSVQRELENTTPCADKSHSHVDTQRLSTLKSSFETPGQPLPDPFLFDEAMSNFGSLTSAQYVRLLEQLRSQHRDFNCVMSWMIHPHSPRTPRRSSRKSFTSSTVSSSNTYEIPETDVIRIGYMLKKGELVKSWKRRLFLLRTNGAIHYYSEKERPKPRGSIDLTSITDVRVTTDPSNSVNTLELLDLKKRIWCIHFDTEKEMLDWQEQILKILQTADIQCSRISPR